MKLIWTKSSSPLSVAIRGMLNEPVSHFGIVFDNGIIFHSNLLGTHIEWYKAFTKKCEVVYEINYTMSLQEEESIYLNILDTYDDIGYDFGALLYFAYRGILLKLFNIPLPKHNELASDHAYLCTEMASTLPSSIIPSSIKEQDLAIISPYNLYLKIIKSKQ